MILYRVGARYLIEKLRCHGLTCLYSTTVWACGEAIEITVVVIGLIKDFFDLNQKRRDDETAEQTLVREVREETGLTVTKVRLVFTEQHPEPYNEQYVFLCEVAPHDTVAIQAASEEDLLNKLGFNTHTPVWADLKSFPRLPFLTPHLHEAIIHALKTEFPDQAITV